MMNREAPTQTLTPQMINQMLNQFRDNVSAIEGKITTMRTDNHSMLFQEFANILNGMYEKQMALEHKLKEHEATLEKIYQGHPDIQIQIESDAKETQELIQKKAKLLSEAQAKVKA